MGSHVPVQNLNCPSSSPEHNYSYWAGSLHLGNTTNKRRTPSTDPIHTDVQKYIYVRIIIIIIIINQFLRMPSSQLNVTCT